MRHLSTVLGTCILALGLAPASLSADAPDPDAANDVVEYYYSDAGAPILLDFKLCNGVYDEGPDKHECLETIDPASVETGTEVYLWMKFLVPQDAEASILTQLNHGGITRRTLHRDLGGALRYRTWHTVTLERTGSWEVAVIHEGPDDVTKLHSVTLDVK